MGYVRNVGGEIRKAYNILIEKPVCKKGTLKTDESGSIMLKLAVKKYWIFLWFCERVCKSE